MNWTWTEIWEQYRYVFTLDLSRYLIAASITYFGVWKLLDRFLGHRYIQKRKPGITHHWREIRYSVSSVAIYAIVGVGIFIGNRLGVFNIYRGFSDFNLWYLPVSLVLLILWHDLYFYWTHKWMHHPTLYKHIHRIHHKSISPSPWTAYSFHPFEAIIQAAFIPLFLFVFPIHGLMLFAFMVYQIARNVIGHLGYELFHNAFITSKWLNWITTTTHHDQHHHYFNHNFGLYFTWWDKWMKTEHPKYAEEFMEVKQRIAEKRTKSPVDLKNKSKAVA